MLCRLFFFERRKIKEQLVENQIAIKDQEKFFSDLEKAKQWLAGIGR
jgi:hypothetical protein